MADDLIAVHHRRAGYAVDLRGQMRVGNVSHAYDRGRVQNTRYRLPGEWADGGSLAGLSVASDSMAAVWTCDAAVLFGVLWALGATGVLMTRGLVDARHARAPHTWLVIIRLVVLVLAGGGWAGDLCRPDAVLPRRTQLRLTPADVTSVTMSY